MAKINVLKSNIFIYIAFFLAGFVMAYLALAPKASAPKNTPTTSLTATTFIKGNFEVTYDASKFNFSSEEFINPDATVATTITLSTKKDFHASLIIRLNMSGIGGACPDFPKGYELSPITLDGRAVEKARYIDEKDRYNAVWPFGNIYLVQKGKYGYNCPNVAGLTSEKNGSSTIKYDIGQAVSDERSSEIEKEFDAVVTSIKGFW